MELLRRLFVLGDCLSIFSLSSIFTPENEAERGLSFLFSSVSLSTLEVVASAADLGECRFDPFDFRKNT